MFNSSYQAYFYIRSNTISLFVDVLSMTFLNSSLVALARFMDCVCHKREDFSILSRSIAVGRTCFGGGSPLALVLVAATTLPTLFIVYRNFFIIRFICLPSSDQFVHAPSYFSFLFFLHFYQMDLRNGCLIQVAAPCSNLWRYKSFRST